MHQAPRYAPSAAKALEAVLWLASERPGIDVYHLVKAAFFADKHHVAEYGRPIAGDDYNAAAFGPLPQVIYGLLRHDPIELLALGRNDRLPFRVTDAHQVYPDRGPNDRLLSESDIEALRLGLGHVTGKSFDDLYYETHDDPAYLRANGGRMDYRDFIPDSDPEKAKKQEYLEEVAAYTVF